MNWELRKLIQDFAYQVAPLYVINNWLGLGGQVETFGEGVTQLEEAQLRVEGIAYDLATHLLEIVERNPDVYSSTSTARVIVWHEPGGPDDIPALRFGLDIDAAYKDGDQFKPLGD